MADTAPGISWYKYFVGGSCTLLSDSTVDYDAVQAGNYSNTICVRPQFSSTSTTGKIGKIRFWWNNIQGTIGQTKYKLPAKRWVMKYYVSDCVSIAGETITTTPKDQNAGAMLQLMLNNSITVKESMTKGTTFQVSDPNAQYYDSTWDKNPTISSPTPSRTSRISMQPIPFFKGNNIVDASTQWVTFKSSDYYNVSEDNELKNILFIGGSTSVYPGGGSTAEDKPLYYSVGGTLNGTYTCNIKTYVQTNQDFPFIFLTIKPPTDADAGDWSGFSCRLSFIWPYTKPAENN